MKSKIGELTPEDKAQQTEVYLWAEVARCGVLDPQETLAALRDELDFMRHIATHYEVDGEEGWEIDPVDQCIYEAVE